MLTTYRTIWPDGSTHWSQSQGRALYAADGTSVGATGTMMDITQRKNAEAHGQLLTTALEASANAVVVSDRMGSFEWANPAFTDLTGYTLAEILGLSTRLLKSGKQDADFYRDLWARILSGDTWRGELVNRRKDGSLYSEEMTITPVRDEAGEIAHFVAIKQDVTARKQAENSLACQRRTQSPGLASRTYGHLGMEFRPRHANLVARDTSDARTGTWDIRRNLGGA